MPAELLQYNVYPDTSGSVSLIGEVIATNEDEALIVAQNLFDSTVAMKVYLDYQYHNIELSPYIRKPGGLEYLPILIIRRKDVSTKIQELTKEYNLAPNELGYSLDVLPEDRYEPWEVD